MRRSRHAAAYRDIKFVDIDYYVTEKLEYSELAKDIVDIMSRYEELSPTGISIRLLFGAPETKEVRY